MKITNKMIDNISYDKMLKTALEETVTPEQTPYTVTLDVSNELVPLTVLKENGTKFDVLAPNGGDYSASFNAQEQLEIVFNTAGTYKIVYGTN